MLLAGAVLAAPAAADGGDAEAAAQDALLERWYDAQSVAEMKRIEAEACSRWGGVWCPGYEGEGSEQDPAPEPGPDGVSAQDVYVEQCSPPDCNVNSEGYHSRPQERSSETSPCEATDQHCQDGIEAAESRVGTQGLQRPPTDGGTGPTSRRMAGRALCVKMAIDLDLIEPGGRWSRRSGTSGGTDLGYRTVPGKFNLHPDRHDQTAAYESWLGGCTSVMSESQQALQLLRRS